MHTSRTTELIGHAKLKAHFQNCSELGDYMVSLNSGDGRTTVSHYILEQIMDRHPYRFGEMEKILEYKSFSGSQEEADKIIADIYNKSERYNSFRGIICLPGEDIVKHVNSKAVDFMLNHLLGEIGEESILIFFFSSTPSVNETLFVDRFKKRRNKPLFTFPFEPYSPEELAQIHLKNKHIFSITEEEHARLCAQIEAADIHSVRDLLSLGVGDNGIG